MFREEDIGRIRETVFRLTGPAAVTSFEVEEAPGLSVTLEGGTAHIAAESLPALARGFFRIAQEIRRGRTAFALREEKRFASCGPFFDVSRGGVLTVSGCKRALDMTAALGLNLFVLYMEDTFTVPEYPAFGYLRGRYTEEELRGIDDYAASLGIELVPCIQTLGHLGQFLQWDCSASLRDNNEVLLIDDPATYDFIEAQIAAIRRCVRGSRLHIGMDEAHGVGLGRYLALHGPQDRFELLSRHLARVTAICEKNGFRPLMWSDMFFRLGSKDNAYYDMDAVIPQPVIDSLPPVDLVYWDYYHQDERWYEHMLTQHERMAAKAQFAGGVWTWSGFLPHPDLTRATMEPALRVCAGHRTDTVMATMWGDDGCETDPMLAMSLLPRFSEACWRAEYTEEELADTGELLTGLPRALPASWALFYPGAADDRIGKSLIWCDLLYPVGPDEKECAAAAERAHQALGLLAACPEGIREALYTALLFRVAAAKAELIPKLRAMYRAGDRAGIREAAETIPDLIELYRQLCAAHRAQWHSSMKRTGWEILALRYGAVMGRLEDVRQSLSDWAYGRLDRIDELAEDRLSEARPHAAHSFASSASPVRREGNTI